MSTLNELRAIDTALRDTLENCNDTLLGISAETLADVPQRIGEAISVATNNGYDTGREDGYSHGYDDGVGIGVEQGKQMAYDEFWDTQQDNGNRTNGQYLYAGNGWNDTTFNPKHSLILTSAERMFASCGVTNVKSILEKNGIVFDFSQSTGCLQFCSNSTVTHLGVLDFSNCTNGLNQVFYSANALKSVEKLKIAEDGSQAFATTSFQGTGALTEIRIEGKFGVSVTFQWSPLSVASMKSIIAALMNYSGTEYANTCKITFSNACWEALEADSTAPDGGTWKDYVYTTLCWNV